MVKRILPAPDIECVTICKKWFSAKFFYIIRHHFRIVRAQKCQVAILSKM